VRYKYVLNTLKQQFVETIIFIGVIDDFVITIILIIH